MNEYEIINDDKRIGSIKVFNNIDYNTTIIESKDNYKYKVVKDKDLQTYIIGLIVNDDDELYDKVSLYKSDDVFEEIELIKKYNNIKHIKKNTKISIILPLTYLKRFHVDVKSINIMSLFNSKVNFVKEVLKINKNSDLKDKLNNVIVQYNKLINSNEFEFYTEEEKNNLINKYVDKINDIIKYIEKNSKYKFGQDFITPIRINN